MDWCWVYNTCEGTLTQRMQCSEPHNMETAQLEFHIQRGYGKAFLSAQLTGSSGWENVWSIAVSCVAVGDILKFLIETRFYFFRFPFYCTNHTNMFSVVA